MRIAIAGFKHETNTFAPTPADVAAFKAGGGRPSYLSGQALIDFSKQDANVSVNGFVRAALKKGHTIVPTFWCSASPSGPVTKEAFEEINDHILSSLQKVLPVDAVYLDLHGAMVADHYADGEGELLARVRRLVGNEVPVVASLDLHCNATSKMLTNADALVAYRTYPHIDMAETGERTFKYLQKRFEGLPRQQPFVKRIPFLIPICWQSTFIEPAKSIYEKVIALGTTNGVDSISYCMGFPAADFEECSGVIWAYGQDDLAEQAVTDLFRQVLDTETAFSGKLYSPQEAVEEARLRSNKSNLPVVIADAQDNPGAGSNSDTTGMLRELVRVDAQKAAIGLIVDPEAARLAHQAGAGSSVRVALGGKSGIPDDEPYEETFFVEMVSDGIAVATGPFYKGMKLSMGLSACLRIGDVRIAVSSQKAQMADQELFRMVGIEPTEQNILVVKSSVHFRADFQPIADSILVAVAPGSMKMDPRDLPWKDLSPEIRMLPKGPSFKAWKQAVQKGE